MTNMNRSLWQDEAGVPGVIRERPIPSQIADEQIVVKDVPLAFIEYPLILGEDIAGTVESVGSAAATKF
ncbi:hypothetical protein N7465_010355 [Penicillium sp. CMV-2018d]|nr:hypothetical protein N7465_010355 [Penicillium sp. CMV-2018d]